jgi:hypothetical protein
MLRHQRFVFIVPSSTLYSPVRAGVLYHNFPTRSNSTSDLFLRVSHSQCKPLDGDYRRDVQDNIHYKKAVWATLSCHFKLTAQDRQRKDQTFKKCYNIKKVLPMIYTYHQQPLYSRRRNTYLENKSKILENTISDREGRDKRCMKKSSE